MSWLDALGWAGSALLVFSLAQARVLLLNLIACVTLVIFNGLLGIWPVVAMNVVLVGINLWFIRKLLTARHDAKTYEVLEVGPNNEYLRHVLRVHSHDILKFQPDFVWDGAAEGRSAYLVQRGDETVGVVLIRDAGDGTAQVELDYVTPRFRDFSPGEFVWRRSGLMKEGASGGSSRRRAWWRRTTTRSASAASMTCSSSTCDAGWLPPGVLTVK